LDKVKCDKHGTQELVLSCQHLTSETQASMFLVPADKDEGATVWCAKCEDARIKDKGWFDYADSVADWKVICQQCLTKLESKATDIIEFEPIQTPDEK